jgi:NAD(P)-dependent dehydrogenase (short-subunit alcohol dehydrogenase family)
MQITGASVIVTGGAAGLGAATTQRLHEQGAKVVIADLNVETGIALQRKLGVRSWFIPTDVTDETSMQQAIRSAVEQHGGVHVLVNCAGILLAEKILGKAGPHDLGRFAKVIHVNLVGTFNALRLVAAVMAQNRPNEEGERGVIINTASIAAFEGQIGQAAYAASKAAVAGLTLPAARELARNGIRVVSIAPGIFETAMLASLSEAARASLSQQVPFPPRLGHPEEYAALVQHIIENVMLNGETIRLDGALRLAPR